MADNVQITEGTGTAVHADEYTHATFGAGKTQLVKIVYGAPGTGIDAIAGAGAVTTGTPRVTLASDDPAVTAVQIIDDWDESDRAKVNPIVGQAGIAAGAGAVGATVPRVTLASDDPAVTALQLIDNAISGAGFNITQLAGATVPIGAGLEATAVRVTLPTDGTGKVSLAASSGTDIGNVGVPGGVVATNAGTFVVQENGAALTALQLIDNAVSGAGFNITQFGGAAVPIGAGTEAAAIRVTLPTNGTGVVGLAAGTAAIGKVGHDTTGIGHGVTTVTTAGTDVVLAGSTAAKWVSIQAQTDNTNKIAVGATGVDATVATGTGILLDPGDVITLPVDNLADVFIDSLVNGEGVRYTYGT